MELRFEYVGVRVDGACDCAPSAYESAPGSCAGHRAILTDFSAAIPVQGVTALVGPSGAGKTTLLRLLNRLDDPDAGEVRYCGRDVRSYDVLELRRRVQYVGQVPVAFPGSVAENLRLGRASGPPAPEAAELLERVGLDVGLAGREADRLSVGEAQRMGLARALARNPDCLLLDEPTSALDAASKSGVERLVRSLADDGLTVVMVTHDSHQATQVADRAITVEPPASP